MNVAPPSIVSGKRCLQTFLKTQCLACNKLSAPAPSLSTSSSTYGAKQAVSTLSSPPAPPSTYGGHPSTSSSVSLLALLALLPPARLKNPPARPARHIRAHSPRTSTSLAARTTRPAATTCWCSATAGEESSCNRPLSASTRMPAASPRRPTDAGTSELAAAACGPSLRFAFRRVCAPL